METLKEETLFAGIRDSKRFSKSSAKLLKERKEITKFLLQATQEGNVIYSQSNISSDRIDEINILRATFEGWVNDIKSVSEQLHTRFADRRVIIHVIIDGNRIPGELIKLSSPEFKVESMVKGDDNVREISAASIIAKQTRDEVMIKYAKQYPEYGFEFHMGYGTAYHTIQIDKHGLTPIHRKSFDLPDLDEAKASYKKSQKNKPKPKSRKKRTLDFSDDEESERVAIRMKPLTLDDDDDDSKSDQI